jgi:tetratricopeptide (TPR) repeat protein
MLAHHWSAALRYAEAAGREPAELVERARAALIEAGDRALSLNAASSAAGFYEEALALGRDEPRADLLLRYGRSLYLGGDERAERILTDAGDALAAARDPEGEAFAEAMLAHMSWLAGDHDASSRRTARAVELARPLPASETKAHVLARAAGAANVAERLEEAVALGREALAIAEELGLDDLRIHAMTTIGTARTGLGDDAGFDDLERAVALALAANSREAGRSVHNLGVQVFLQGDVARYHELHAEGLRHHERFGDAAMARFSRGGAPAIGYFVGEWERAVREADAFLAESETTSTYMEPQARAFRALIRLARDDVDGAVADVERALALVDGAADPQRRAAPLASAARVFLELGDPRAVATASELLEMRFGSLPEPVSVTTLPALDLPHEVEERLRAVFEDPAVDGSLWVAAGRTALELRFLEAAEMCASMPFRPAEAHLRLRAAEQLLAEGRRGEADEQLGKALAFWRSVGAIRYLREGEGLLAATA